MFGSILEEEVYLYMKKKCNIEDKTICVMYSSLFLYVWEDQMFLLRCLRDFIVIIIEKGSGTVRRLGKMGK